MSSLMLTLVISAATVSCEDTWLTSLPDSKLLNSVDFKGTRHSATRPLTRQLEEGVRILDMHVRRTDGAFAMHANFNFLGMMFGDMVQEVESFLERNPGELVIMMMQDEDNTVWRNWFEKSACEILQEKYLKEWPILVQRWSFEDEIGEHRGRILLARKKEDFPACIDVVMKGFQ